ncbi:FAD-binding oxidoreductase [Limnochorda pilosa]|uniref:Glycolate oxidase subunit GlcD n=1 Tax=Limnochorda pilosa TaxID=1555112 RepID=A0A0K2SQ14_LIMPI|nr:FAD-linked oxidase C-terminal domain-containing protein [Limnochorda pilosa]BAS29208.1 glycolate oxidase subunit GlcD [Limnochorda pilosa]
MIDSELVKRMRALLGTERVLASPEELLVYECDGLTLYRNQPELVVLPETTEEVASIVRLLKDRGVPFVPRGAGTSLSGGTFSEPGVVQISLARMRRILRVDLRNRRAVVQAGVVNLHLSQAVEQQGYHYAPDPSSQGACTIGGNVAENSGGPHTLKYGVTVNHVLGLKVVLPSGEVVELGGPQEDPPGYDLVGLITGSEGTLGIVTEATVRLTRNPQAWKTYLAVFESVEDATRCVSGIISRGIIPAALEMMDHLVIQAVEAAFRFGFPLDAGAVLIVELDGPAEGLPEEGERVEAVFREHGAREVRTARDARERAKLWASRKKAFGAVGRLSPSYVTQDGVVPRSRLPEIMARAEEVGRRHGIRIANVFHAGDGNIHPLLLYDERDPEQVERVLAASDELLEACIELGGALTGEHGVGIEKKSHLGRLFSEDDLQVMLDVHDVFNPDSRCNPGKIFPSARSCVEVRRPRAAAPA